VARKKGSDNFGFNSYKANKSVEQPRTIRGSDNPRELITPLPFKRRFRPATGTKDFSLLSDYDYASLWARWRRGYELSMYSQQAYDGLMYSFKYFPTGTIGAGAYVPGACFMYPSTRTDMRMWMVGVRPRDSFNFLNFGYAISAVTKYNDSTYAVQLNTRFGAPISLFTGEVISNRFNADGTEKQYGYNNYTVTAVGVNNVPRTPSYAPIFNTLFISVTADNSWSVVDATTLAVPATGPPLVGEYFTTEMRAQCTCPDFLNRENFNLYEISLRKRYPFTRVQNLDPGFYDAGPDQTTRLVDAQDNPGYARAFGFIYLRQIYNIPSVSEQSYSDPNLYYYQPKWCKHIYAAMWDMQIRYNQGNATQPWLHQPNDEPMNEYYREKFDMDLKKQFEFLKREKDLVWWQRYSPTINDMPSRITYPDMYNMMTKTLNVGGLETVSEMYPQNFEMFTIPEYDPFAPVNFQNLLVYDGGTYLNANSVLEPVNILDGSTYRNGTQIPPAAYSLNGGIY
jgi:hypothetical protein